MTTSERDFLLNFYRERTSRFRGDSLTQRLDGLCQRWSKVIKDCESSADTSKYRQDYRYIHSVYLSRIEAAINNAENDFNLAHKLLSFHKELCHLYIDNFCPAGFNSLNTGNWDGAGYMIAELEAVLDV